MSVRKLSIMLFLVNGLQFLLGAGMLIGLQSNAIEHSEMVLDLAMGLVPLSSLLSITGLFSVTRYQKRNYQESMENLENLNTRLREQRHDYLNQIQVVYGLLELEEYQEARDYLRPVFRDIMKVNRALKTAQPAVNALLQAKMEEAERQGIDFYPEVAAQLQNLNIEPWELCKILANLLDNAMTAVAGLEGERKITLRIEETKDTYYFLVQNNGPEIPQQQQKLIFRKGYTTKNEEGHGMGLFIVSSALKEAGGTIRLESVPGETTFSFTLPVNSVPKSDRLRGKMYK
ncbi:MAG: ATP-binding protein [Candidatus Limivivens sp.]|nr:ATP-binding protein [Candidatus Limivivens sp.]